MGEFVLHYNTVRLNSATEYVTPQDLLSGLAPETFAERDRKLAEPREGGPPNAALKLPRLE